MVYIITEQHSDASLRFRLSIHGFEELTLPFTPCRLAILAHDKSAEESMHRHYSTYKDQSNHSSMVDSRKSVPSSYEGSSMGSRNNSLAFTGSVGLPSRVSDLSIDSKRSLQPSTSFGSTSDGYGMRSARSTQTLAGN